VPISSVSEPLLLDKQGLANRYSVKIRTVDYWVAEKLIPVIKIGRLDRFYAPDCDPIILEKRRSAASEKQPRKIRVKRPKDSKVEAGE
jgi:hypothetical protein